MKDDSTQDEKLDNQPPISSRASKINRDSSPTDNNSATPPPLTNPLDVIRFLWRSPHAIRLYWRLFREKRVPRKAKFSLIFALLLAVVYVISPIDLIPDWLLPIIGEMDDIAVVLVLTRFGLKWLVQLSPSEVVAELLSELKR